MTKKKDTGDRPRKPTGRTPATRAMRSSRLFDAMEMFTGDADTVGAEGHASELEDGVDAGAVPPGGSSIEKSTDDEQPDDELDGAESGGRNVEADSDDGEEE